MCVIIQEMVESEYSGICFTVDPVSGNDKTMLIEVGEGLGENIVSGQNKPEQYYFNWYDETYEENKDNKFLNEKTVKKIGLEFYKIMQYFGYPCDIEFALVKNELFILQSRKITKIEYQGYNYIWSTADFKDGGVSASVCTPYMWSLYEYIWEYTLKKFILDSKILNELELPSKLGDMFYGRCYCEKNNPKLKEELLTKYFFYKGMYDTESILDIKSTWKKLTHDDYLFSESTYFWQIFINTVHQSLKKDSLLKYIDESDYLSLLSNIDDISHLLPFYDMWDVSRKIRNNQETFNYWKKVSVEDIVKDIKYNRDGLFDDVIKVINLYGYHSDKELDVTYPCYYEDISPIIINIKDLVLLEDAYSPKNDIINGKKQYDKKLKTIKKRIGEGNYQDLEKNILKIRDMLWWREEFRDLSTRFYYLIRIYTIEFAKELVKENVLKDENDIWFLKVANLWDYLDDKLDSDDLETIIDKNKKYYNAYRNYTSENEIGSVFSNNTFSKKTSNMKGLGANNGIVTGTARVIESFEEIDRLQEGDILVTKFTDTGWTPKFAILSGIVTEYGGVLCHAAIVSREYGIPAIVSATDIMQQIKDGETITINGTTGEIKKGK